MFIYENHLGGLFASDDQIPFEDLFCEECGDCDWEIGEANTRKEAEKLLHDEYGEDEDLCAQNYFTDFLDRYFPENKEEEE